MAQVLPCQSPGSFSSRWHQDSESALLGWGRRRAEIECFSKQWSVAASTHELEQFEPLQLCPGIAHTAIVDQHGIAELLALFVILRKLCLVALKG